MPWVKRINLKTVLVLTLLATLFFVTHVPRLATNAINPDGVNWHYRSQQFIVGLKSRDFAKTYQHYHPGVTLMWIMGLPVEALKQLSPDDQIINTHNFEIFHFASKYALVVAQLFLTVLVVYLLSQHFGFVKALLVALLFSFEPFFFGNSRLLHLDVLLSLLLFAGFLFNFLWLKTFRFWYLVFSGLFLALAFLTKSVGIVGFGFVLVYSAIYLAVRGNLRLLPKFLLGFVGSFVVATILFFPAMWEKPVWVIGEIFSEAERVGGRKGHGQVLFGEYTRNGGVWFYPLVVGLKVSLFTLLGLLAGFAAFFLRRDFVKSVPGTCLQVDRKKAAKLLSEPLLYLTLFYVGYVILMTIPSKKIDRYIIPLFPYLALLAVLGYYKVYEAIKHFRFKQVYLGGVAAAAIFLVMFPVVKLFPYNFTYTSPIFGSATRANQILGQKTFGVGIPELKALILQKYGNYPNLGFIDTKPMKTIYGNSKVFDIRISGADNYDLLVLGINDEYNDDLAETDIQFSGVDKVILNDTTFVKDDALYINGLEYWRVYVKKSD